MNRTALFALSALPALSALVASRQAPVGNSARVQLGVLIRPETVTVGEHFEVTVRVRAPRGATIGFPAGPDSASGIDLVDPRVVRPSPASPPDTTATDQMARYRLAAWDTGKRAVPLGELLVQSRAGGRRLPLTGISVYVRSVLPADTALHIPKPARDIAMSARPWWPILLALLALLALIALAIWWWRRRRRARPAAVPNPLEEAEREFARIDALRLLEAGEHGRFVALNVEVMRDYLARRIESAARSLTSLELARVLRENRSLSTDRLASLLAEADLIKFARRSVTVDRARELALETRALVRDTERALTPPPAVQAA